MNSVIKTNHDLLTGKSPIQSRESIKTVIKNNVIIPKFNFEKLNQENTSPNKEQKIFLDTELFNVIRKENKKPNHWPDEYTPFGKITK